MNNDLISRSALIEWFSPYLHEDEAIPPDVVIGDIKAAPAVEVVDVVRCKDCRFWRNFHAVDNCFLPSGLSHAAPDSYCSLGRRKDK